MALRGKDVEAGKCKIRISKNPAEITRATSIQHVFCNTVEHMYHNDVLSTANSRADPICKILHRPSHQVGNYSELFMLVLRVGSAVSFFECETSDFSPEFANRFSLQPVAFMHALC